LILMKIYMMKHLLTHLQTASKKEIGGKRYLMILNSNFLNCE